MRFPVANCKAWRRLPKAGRFQNYLIHLSSGGSDSDYKAFVAKEELDREFREAEDELAKRLQDRAAKVRKEDKDHKAAHKAADRDPPEEIWIL
jgi:hypothetical protein